MLDHSFEAMHEQPGVPLPKRLRPTDITYPTLQQHSCKLNRLLPELLATCVRQLLVPWGSP